MDIKRQTKIIKLISDYDEVNRSYIKDLVSKEEEDEAFVLLKAKIKRMKLTDEEREYSMTLLTDCFNRMTTMIKIPKDLRISL